MGSESRPSALFVYFSYTQQTKNVLDAMADVLRGRGIDVALAAIELTDPRYAARFQEFPMPKPYREVVGMVPAELRRKPAQIKIPEIVTERQYDLVCIGAPTWWLSTDVPIRSFLESDTAGESPRREALCCCCLLPAVLEAQPEHSAQARDRAWRYVHRRHPLPLRRRAGALPPVAV